jgi:hypothetical protein
MNDENHTVATECGRKAILRWPARILGPLPGSKELSLAGWSWFASLLILKYLPPLWIRLKAGSGLTNIFPSDFIYFYGIGQIANKYPLTRLYDYSLQLKIFNGIYPLSVHDGSYGPSPYPPYVALFFSLFARVPIQAAFFLWAGVSLSLYIAGIAAAVKGLFPGEGFKISLIFSLALAFCPFLHNTFANGQIATLAVFSVGLTIWQERYSRPFSSGLALAILAYKPTLLLLVVPMLLLTRRFRTFCGFITGTALLALTATAFAGIQVWSQYARFLSFFGRFVGADGRSILFVRQYVDIKSFIQGACGGWSRTEFVILMAVTIPAAIGLSIMLWRSAKGGRPEQFLAWAATLTWTLLLNVYVPVYDSILVSVAVILTLAALRELGWKVAMRWMTILAVLISAGSWELESIAQSRGIQFLPVLLAILGMGQLYLLHRAILQGSPQMVTGQPLAEATLAKSTATVSF